MLKFKFAKLVRDKIVEEQLAAGADPKYYLLNRDEHIKALVNKIMEEAQEIQEADTEHVAGEIADVQQAIDDLIERLGITRKDVATAQQEKTNKAGTFKKGIFIEYVEIDEHDPWVAYYRKNSDRYPEIE
jgi:predicted house-cleaning noncanonical NTP pyrophosphatase (MazG superfamily)